MWFSPIFERFVEKSPVTVILRALMEVALDSSKLDELFEQTAQTGYTKEILFSTLVKMMSLVVCSVRQSIGSVYKATSEEIGVSKTAVYDKLNRLEPCVSRALVQSTALDLATIIHQSGGERPGPLPFPSTQNSRWEWSGGHRTSSVCAPRYQCRSVAREIFGGALPSTGASHGYFPLRGWSRPRACPIARGVRDSRSR